MTEQADTTQHSQTIEGEGITSLRVSVTRSDKVGSKLLSHTTELIHEFGRPMQVVDVVAPHARLTEQASGLAQKELDQAVAQANAEQSQAAAAYTAPAPQAQQATPAPAAPVAAPQPQAQPGQLNWQQASRPNNSGTFRYLPTSSVSTDELKQRINAKLAELGENPSLFNVYDNRIGQYGIESGKQVYSVAAVKPSDAHPAHGASGMQTQKGNPKSAYYCDFEDDGSVSVNPSKDYESWLEVQRQVQAQLAAQQAQPPVAPPPADVPF